MADDKLMLEAHEALHDMIQWVAVFAAAAGSNGVVMKSPRMAKAQAVLEKLDRAAGVAPTVEACGCKWPDCQCVMPDHCPAYVPPAGVSGLAAQTKPPPDADAQAGDHGDADAGEGLGHE